MLFLKELKKVVCSVTFILYLAVLLGFYATQFSSELDNRLKEPVEGCDNYGITETTEPSVIIPAAIQGLLRETENNQYVAYPIGFYKEITLNNEKQKKMEELLMQLKTQYESGSLSYETFLEYMDKADKLIGGGSRYSDSYLIHNFGTVPASYEDAKKEYEEFVSLDKVTGAYARLFCDYLGIVLAVMPVFVAASLIERDRKAQMEQLVFSRKITSASLVLNRFFALAAAMMLPVILLSVVATVKICGLYQGVYVDLTAMVVMAVLWLLPNLLVAAGIGMVFTEMYSPLLAVFVQGLWWISSIGSGRLTGGIGKFTLVLRHNNLMKRQVFIAQMDNFLFNRCFYTILAFALVSVTVWVYARKRRGGFGGSVGVKKNFDRKLKASV